MKKEAVVAECKVLSQHFPGGSEERHEKCQSVQLVCGLDIMIGDLSSMKNLLSHDFEIFVSGYEITSS